MPPPAGKLKHCQLKRCQVAASSHQFSARQRGPTRPSGGGAAAQTGSSWGSKHEFASRCGVWTETHPVLGDNLLDDVCQRHSKVLNALAGREPDLRLSRLPPLAPRLLALGIARRHLPRHRHCRQQFTPSMLVSSPMCNLAVTAGFVTSRPWHLPDCRSCMHGSTGRGPCPRMHGHVADRCGGRQSPPRCATVTAVFHAVSDLPSWAQLHGPRLPSAPPLSMQPCVHRWNASASGTDPTTPNDPKVVHRGRMLSTCLLHHPGPSRRERIAGRIGDRHHCHRVHLIRQVLPVVGHADGHLRRESSCNIQ